MKLKNTNDKEVAILKRNKTHYVVILLICLIAFVFGTGCGGVSCLGDIIGKGCGSCCNACFDCTYSCSESIQDHAESYD